MPRPEAGRGSARLRACGLAWLVPILATSAFLLVHYDGPRLVARPWLRNAVLILLVAALAAAVVGGPFGAFINKVAPIV